MSREDVVFVYKIVHREVWREAPDPWPGNADDLRDGFVHLSEARQVSRTLDKWFDPGRDDLELLELAVRELDADALRWEGKPGGDRYPHLYMPLHKARVRRHWSLSWDGSRYVLPAPLRD